MMTESNTGENGVSYDIYVNLRYDDEALRTLIDLASAVSFFGDGEMAEYSATQFAAHNDRYRDTAEHAYLNLQNNGQAQNDSGEDEHGHGFELIINRTGRSAAFHDAGPGDFNHARQTIRDLASWLRANVAKARVERASITSSWGYADYAYVGVLGGWQVTDAGDGRTPTTAAL